MADHIDVLHIIQCLSSGGAARAMLAAAKRSSQEGPFRHRVLSILPPTAQGLALARDAGSSVTHPTIEKPARSHIEQADIVQVHYWNNPELNRFLRRELPAMRLLIWFHVAGDQAPQIICKDLISFADYAVACSPYQLQIKAFRDLPEEVKRAKTDLVIAPPDFGRLQGVRPRHHDTFNIGYIGTIDPTKMHPDFVEISSGVQIPEARFLVCGSGDGVSELRHAIEKVGMTGRFELRGYVEDIASVLEVLDVFGYPLCKGNYSAADLVLQEAMHAGVPPVIFPYGGTQTLVQSGETGLIVSSAEDYQRAIRFLYENADERRRLGHNARAYAQRHFGAEIAAHKFNVIYTRLIKHSKRTRPRLTRTRLKSLPNNSLEGAEMFITSLGDASSIFVTSLTSSSNEELTQADTSIARSGPLLVSRNAGGVFHYRAAYPDDPYLRFWTALILEEQGLSVRAYIELKKAIELGFDHSRVLGYLARTAKKIGAPKDAQESMDQPLDLPPGPTSDPVPRVKASPGPTS